MIDGLPRAQAVVEQCVIGFCVRWHFVLRDERGDAVHEGEPRLTKLEAMADRDRMTRSAYNHRDDADLPRELRVALRAAYITRDSARASGA